MYLTKNVIINMNIYSFYTKFRFETDLTSINAIILNVMFVSFECRCNALNEASGGDRELCEKVGQRSMTAVRRLSPEFA